MAIGMETTKSEQGELIRFYHSDMFHQTHLQNINLQLHCSHSSHKVGY